MHKKEGSIINISGGIHDKLRHYKISSDNIEQIMVLIFNFFKEIMEVMYFNNFNVIIEKISREI